VYEARIELIRDWDVGEERCEPNLTAERATAVNLLSNMLSFVHLFASTALGNGVPDVLYGSRNDQTEEEIFVN
jgi:hypothetical protein